MNLTQYRDKLNILIAERIGSALMVEQEGKELAKAEQSLLDVKDAQELLQTVAQQVQQTAHDRIASVVTRCLQSVFSEDYAFLVHFERKRGKTEARLSFTRCGEEFDPLDEMGGGVLDVAAFALRLAALLLTRPERRRLLCLDEPFRCLSAKHHERVRELLETLAEELGMQMVIVSHNPNLVTGKVVEL